MSEYQYYEFRAVDRRLTSDEMAELRSISSRAHITSTGFVNTYTYGDFRGNYQELMAKIFDAFVYVANWGTHEFMLRLPRPMLDSLRLTEFCTGIGLRAWLTAEHIVLAFRAEELDSDWEQGEGWMDSLLPVRGDLLQGDLRALYLGWLCSLQYEEMDDDQPEPPPPPGLRHLSPHLISLVKFLDIDVDLLETAAESSADQSETSPSREEYSRWVTSLPEAEKNAVLLDLVTGANPHLRADLLRRFRSQAGIHTGAETSQQALRTVGELRAAAEARTEEKERCEAERERQEQEREERERAIARAKHLDALSQREPETWSRVDALIATKRPNDYDSAVELLRDLRELAERNQRSEEFRLRLSRLREQHSRKPGLLARMGAAGLE